jgi:hypothetical protein
MLRFGAVVTGLVVLVSIGGGTVGCDRDDTRSPTAPPPSAPTPPPTAPQTPPKAIQPARIAPAR